MADDLDVEALLEASLKSSTQPQKDAPQETASSSTEVSKNGSAPEKVSRSEKESKSDSKDDKHRKRRSKSRSRSRDRHRHKRRRHSRSRSRDRRSRRSRSRSPRGRDRRDRDRDRDRGRDRDHERDRDRRRDRRGRSAGKDDEILTPEEQERRRKQKEAEEADRDERTVFASNLPIRASESDLFEFFGKAGKVHDIRLITDRNSRKSKGFGYIEYLDKSSVPIALHQLNGTQCKGQTVLVQITQAEKNRAAAAAAAAAANAPPSLLAPTRLYVGNLHTDLAEDDLRTVFEPFGEIQLINLHTDPETGRSKGFAFVQYKSPEDAKKALQHCNGMELAGRQLKVGIVSDPGTLTAGGPGAGFGGPIGFGGGGGGFGGGGFGGGFGGGGGGGGLNELDDEGGGLGLNAQSRAMLMARLAGQTGGAGFPTLPGAPMSFPGMTHGFPAGLLPGVLPGLGMPGLTGLPTLGGLGAPSPLLPTAGAVPTPIIPPTVAPRPAVSAFMLLKNMFDPAQETEPNFHLDIQEDVTEECGKYGKVLQCHVVRDSPSGLVYLRFESSEGASKAIQALNGRWFAGKVISAEFIDENTFLAGCKL